MYFIITINMGVKTKEQALSSGISEENKTFIRNAKVYAEGISVLFTITKREDLDDIMKILSIKEV